MTPRRSNSCFRIWVAIGRRSIHSAATAATMINSAASDTTIATRRQDGRRATIVCAGSGNKVPSSLCGWSTGAY